MDGMGAMGGGHAGHDHSAHDTYHGSGRRRPDGSYTYTHGAFLGHMVPGVFFLVGAGRRAALWSARAATVLACGPEQHA